MSRVGDWRAASLAVLIALVLLSCSEGLGEKKARLLEMGNNYREAGKHKIASILYRKALQQDARFGEAHFQLGQSYLAQGELLAAAGAFWRAYEIDDPGYDAFQPLTKIYLRFYAAQEHSRSRLLSELTYLLDLERIRNPESVEIDRVEGAVALVNLRFEEAILKYERVLTVSPSDLPATLALCNALQGGGDARRAEQLAHDLLKSKPKALPLYDLLYRLEMNRGRWSEAEALRERAIEELPGEIRPRIALAAHYYHMNRRPRMTETLDAVLRKPERFSGAHRLIGVFYVRLNELDRGIEVYNEGIRVDPERVRQYQNGILEALLLRGDRDQASEMLDGILEANPGDVAALALRASLAMTGKHRSGRELAISDLMTALELQPDNAILRFALGETYLRQGDVFNARTQFREALAGEPAFLLPKLALANMHLTDYDFVGARVLAEEVLAVHPGHAGARLLLAEAWIGSREFDEARAALAVILDPQPDNAEALNQLARVNLMERRYGDAMKIYSRIRRHNPEDARALDGMIDALVAQKQLAKARELARRELLRSPDDTALRIVLGRIANNLGDHEEALGQFLAASRREPGDERIQASLGETYMRLGRNELAEECLRNAIRLNPRYPASHIMLGNLHMAADRRSQAIESFEIAIGLAPDNVVALNNLAFLLMEGGIELDRALSLAQRAMAIAPNNPGVADTLGWLYLRKQLPTEALPLFRRLVTLAPKRARWRYSLARALFEAGAADAARVEIEAALACNPTPEEERRIQALRWRIRT